MASPHRVKTNRVEFNSKRHKAMNVDLDWLKGKHYDNTDQVPLTDRDPPLCGALWMEPKFSLQLCGSGTAGTPPPIDQMLIKSLGLAYTNVAATSDSYEATGNLPLADGLAYNLFVGNYLKFAAASVVGNAKIVLKPNEPGIIEFEGSGTYAAPSEVAGASALPTQANPVVCKNLTATLASQASIFKELTFDFGNKHNGPWEDLGSTAVQGVQAPLLIDCMPTAEGLLVVPGLTGFNAWQDMLNNAVHALSAVLGSAAGNILTITAAGYLSEKPELTEVDGVACMRVKYRISWATGQRLKLAWT